MATSIGELGKCRYKDFSFVTCPRNQKVTGLWSWGPLTANSAKSGGHRYCESAHMRFCICQFVEWKYYSTNKKLYLLNQNFIHLNKNNFLVKQKIIRWILQHIINHRFDTHNWHLLLYQVLLSITKIVQKPLRMFLLLILIISKSKQINLKLTYPVHIVSK